MSNESPLLSATTELPFNCECNEWVRQACKGELYYKEYEGKRYCVLPYPGKEKAPEFERAFRKKLEAADFNFQGVWFPNPLNLEGFQFTGKVDFQGANFASDVRFNRATFSAITNFDRATFSAIVNFDSTTWNGSVTFFSTRFNADVSFYSSKFNSQIAFSAEFKARANFDYVTFSAAVDFHGLTFSVGVQFRHTMFEADTNFRNVTFGVGSGFRQVRASALEVSKRSRIFTNLPHAAADFNSAIFKDHISFFGRKDSDEDVPISLAYAYVEKNEQSFDFQFARVEKLERVSFHTMTLRPLWFVNIDPRKFVFTDVDWNWNTISIESEIQSLIEKEVSSPRRLLTIACRQLAENAETNNRYEEASRFRYWAMDILRSEKWAGWTFWKTDWLHILYWAVSGYGERILRAFAWLLAVWIIFALLYTRVDFTKREDTSATPGANSMTATEPNNIGQPLPLKRAFIYSLGVMSLQKPDPKPLTGSAQTLVLLETILGPLQAALLALAIRRQFMR